MTAAIWNADIVANMNNSIMHLHARRTTTQSVVSSIALVSDDTLQLAVAANEVWQFQFHLRYDASTAGDIKISFSFPASGQVDAVSLAPSNASVAYQDAVWTITTSDATPISFAGAGTGSVRTNPIHGTYIGAGTAGTVILRWAQNGSDATATRMLPQSTLWVAKLA